MVRSKASVPSEAKPFIRHRRDGQFVRVPVSARVLEKLEPGSGEAVRSDLELARRIVERLPAAALQRLRRFGFSEPELDTIAPSRTRRLRAQKQEKLTVEESDRMVRLLRIQTLAEDAFGDTQRANAWLRRPLARAGGQSPFDLARTEAGARAVEEMLARIAWGAAV
jgi:putative toxin-antitoxin system antitoxin component (TIGR02293 family)